MESNRPDNTGPNAPPDATSKAIADHLIEFLSHEVKMGRLPDTLLPLQSGIGNIANAVIGGLSTGPFKDITVYVTGTKEERGWKELTKNGAYSFTEVLQDTFLHFFESRKLKYASATSIRFSPDGFKRFYDNWEYYRVSWGGGRLRNEQVHKRPNFLLDNVGPSISTSQ